MKHVKYNNRPSLAKMMEDMINDEIINPISNRLRHPNLPSVNLKETPENFQLEMAASGLKKENFDLEIKDDQLRISYKEDVKDQKNESDYTRMEFNYHSFTRMFTLPESTLSSEIKASYVDGILLVNIPKVKLEKESAKKIVVD